MYRSPGSIIDNNVYLNNLITETVNSRHAHFLLLGDFTYPNISWEHYSVDCSITINYNVKFLENIKNNYLTQHVTYPTRGRMGNQSNILDLVFTNEEGMVDDIIHESPLGKSDHSVFDYVCYAQIADHKQLRFVYNNGNYSSRRDAMSHCSWDNVLGKGDINE